MHQISQPYNSAERQWEFISLTDNIHAYQILLQRVCC